MADRKQREGKQEVTRDKIVPRTHPSDLLPPATVRFLELPKIAPPAEDISFNT
jgi:hypothetical protein